MQTVIPNPMFHYGWDMPLADALDAVLKGSPQPVQIRDGRYVIVSGRSGPYLAGRGFIWIDMHDGVALGGSTSIQRMANLRRRSQFFPGR